MSTSWATRTWCSGDATSDSYLERMANGFCGRVERAAEFQAVFDRALGFRGHLYALFRAVAEGANPPTESVEALRMFECEAFSHSTLAPSGGGGFGWKWALGDDLAGMLWPVAHSATELLTSGLLGWVKGCAGCNWLFVDESKNKSRRWCAMEDCGTHAKMRRYVARRAAKRATSSPPTSDLGHPSPSR